MKFKTKKTKCEAERIPFTRETGRVSPILVASGFVAVGDTPSGVVILNVNTPKNVKIITTLEGDGTCITLSVGTQ